MHGMRVRGGYLCLKQGPFGERGEDKVHWNWVLEMDCSSFSEWDLTLGNVFWKYAGIILKTVFGLGNWELMELKCDSMTRFFSFSATNKG